MLRYIKITTLFLGFLLIQIFANAEGSRNLTPDSTGSATSLTNNFVGCLQHDDNANSQSFLKPKSPQVQRMYVRLNAGDTLHWGLRRRNDNQGFSTTFFHTNLNIYLKSGAGFGTTVKSWLLKRDSSATAVSGQWKFLPQAGIIDNYAKAKIGPKTTTGWPSTGYNSNYYVNNTGASQDFWVEFEQVNESKNSTAKKCWYDLWDFTVRNVGEKKGRVYSKYWSFNATESNWLLSTKFNLYAAIPSLIQTNKYYVKRIELGGMAPFGFFFVCNDSGTRAPGNAAQKAKSQTSNLAYGKFKIFLNDPDTNMIPSAILKTFDVSNNSFANPLTGGSMAITFYVSEPGSAVISFDLDGTPGIQNGTKDRVLTQYFSTPGFHTINWDGKDGTGIFAPSGSKISFAFKGGIGAIHFPLWDVERNADGFRVGNQRPGNSTEYSLLYWNDSNLGTAFSPKSELSGAPSTTGAHKWGATADDGNDLLLNTWTYGTIPNDTISITYSYVNDIDGDGVGNTADIDNDNDGIVDSMESFGVWPLTLSNGVPLYLDAAYIHPTKGAFRDVNFDGINDIFDTDFDGIPDFLDIDADGDGITDALEANDGIAPFGYDNKTGRISGATGSNGMPDLAETAVGSGISKYSLLDHDKDGRKDYQDKDSDNDGIWDNIEAQLSSTYTKPLGKDTDKDGLDDAYDYNSNGKDIVPVNTDASLKNGDSVPDYLDLNSDGDSKPDWIEGFDNNKNGQSFDDLRARAIEFESANSYPGKYNSSLDSDRDKIPNWMDDDNNDGIPNFLDPKSSYYFDSNKDGLVDLFDPLSSGKDCIPSDFNKDGKPDFRDNSTLILLPVEYISFNVVNQNQENILDWKTANESNNDRFEVQRSYDGVNFTYIGEVKGSGNSLKVVGYKFIDETVNPAISVVYYRLKQYDYNGKFEFSPIRKIQLSGTEITKTLVYPNPMNGSNILNIKSGNVKLIRIVSLAGQMILEQSNIENNNIQVNVENIPNGLFILNLIKNDNSIELIKFNR